LIVKWEGGSKLKKNKNRGTKKLIFKIGGSKLQKIKNRGDQNYI
jgi:hypothetical protein